MSKDTDKSLFILPSMPRLYQQLLRGMVSYEVLGNRIIAQIKAAHAFRQVEQVRELAHILINIPIREFRLIAQYYLVWCKCRDLEYQHEALEKIIEQTQTYKAKALISRAAFDFYKGNFSDAMFFYLESFKANPTVSDYLLAAKAIAVIKSIEGFHSSALKDMEKLLPLVRYAEPLACFDVFNSYTVELIEAGRKHEARNISRIVLASPFAPHYPECQETARDLKEPDRSSVVVSSIKPQPAEPETTATRQQQQPARVVSFPPLKEAPLPQKPDYITSEELTHMSADEKREFILVAIRSGAIHESEYTKFIILLGLLETASSEQVIDLEDETALNNLVVEWANLIEPEELAAVLSALRDCDDDLRRTNIIDSIIRKAFEYSRTCNMTEAQWRLKVERRLPEK